MGAEAPWSPSADYMLSTPYTSGIEDYLRSMEGDLPIFSMFPNATEATSASPRYQTRSFDLERHSPSQEQTHQSVSLHSAQDITLPALCAPPGVAGMFLRPYHGICSFYLSR